ncbi:hypothetical protein ACE7GA_07955 [Roseomonas sp. CCTCC AB2023176]|uniref:hypothetical protein n=1 Tax=Roseomonas sp. CCTCC AB2023176 TaxID=3342640 RepID=UPI0035E2F1E6
MSDTSPAAVGPELQRLRTLLDAEQVKLGVNIRQMNAPGSPVYRVMPNVAVPIATLLLSALATIWIHTWAGFAVLIAGSGWWLWKIQPRIKDDVFDRSAALALSEDRMFDALWAKGVLSLYAKLPDGTERAAARRHDWRAFVRDLPGA